MGNAIKITLAVGLFIAAGVITYRNYSGSDTPSGGTPGPAMEPTESSGAGSGGDGGMRESGGSGDQNASDEAGEAGFVERIMGHDANDDGKVTADELPEGEKALLGRADTNGDGALNKDEIEAAAPESQESDGQSADAEEASDSGDGSSDDAEETSSGEEAPEADGESSSDGEETSSDSEN